MEVELEPTEIHFDRAPLRETVTEDSVRMLAGSIRQHGLLQPIVVTPRAEGGYRLIAGRRRLLALTLLQYALIPCRIIEDPGMDELPALAENLMRLNMNPLEEARAVEMLHQQKRLSIADIAERTNHSVSWVQDRLALMKLDTALQEAVANKSLSIGAAMQLALIEDQPLRDWYIHLAKVNGASVHQCEAWYLEWKARDMLTQGKFAPSNVSQPPPPIPEPLIPCFGCNELRPATHARVVHICGACWNLIGPDTTSTQPLQPSTPSTPTSPT